MALRVEDVVDGGYVLTDADFPADFIFYVR
jgi:hypothetical protein